MVIPVLNEAATIETTLAALQKIPGLSEMITTIAMVASIGLKELAEVIFPYPTLSEVFKKVADEHQTRKLKGWKTWALKKWSAAKL
ncbi:MAG: hypothetical protein M3O30_03100 [Planctomycetota bacterium]|nr:hypothetical protein [Planctomycetota bacterium]